MHIEINIEKAIAYMVRNFGIEGQARQLADAVLNYWNDYASNYDETLETYLTEMFRVLAFDAGDVKRMLAEDIITFE